MNNTKPQVNNMFLIGAGFTKAVFPQAPLNKDLLPILCDGAASTTIKRLYRAHKVTDIEILLTHLDLEILRPKQKKQIALQQVRKKIEQKLAEYFEQFRFQKEIITKSIWLKDFANLFQPNDAIISLNYDCLLEGVLDYYEVWSPADGYPGIGAPPPFVNLPANLKKILIFKIHGSEHFIEAPDPMNNTRNAIGFLINESIYPRSGKHEDFDFGIHDLTKCIYIIAPSFVKIPNHEIELMMLKALKTSESVKNFVIIGCGLRKEDSFLWLLLTNFLNQSISNRKLIIVDPYAEEIKSKICDHYFVDINEFINIRLCSNGLECAFEQLINELHENKAQ